MGRFFRVAASCLAAASCCFLQSVFGTEVDEQTRIQIEALSRLKGMDLEANPALKGAVLKVVEKTRGTPQFVELVRDFKLEGQEKALIEYALAHPGESLGVEAFRMALAERDSQEIQALLKSEEAARVVQLMGNAGLSEFQPLLRELVSDSGRSLPVRKEAVRALAKSQDGAASLLGLAERGELLGDLRLTAAAELNLAPWPEVKSRAAEILPLPASSSAAPLPPISELTRRAGDPARGRKIFFSETAACSSCHQVGKQGMDFGPNLSEIGTKLGKEALYEAILDPSSGISFGYEAWSLELADGEEAYGLITSETGEEIALKTQGGIVTKYRKSEVAGRRKMQTSIMPSGLQLTMTPEELVDLVEYLASLKKPAEN